MNPSYKFSLAITQGETTNTYDVNPLWGNSLSKECERESNQFFFREKINGDLTFIGSDYALIKGADFEAEFTLTIFIRYAGEWSQYLQGVFFKTDCQWNEDDRKVVVTPNPKDSYSDLLAGMEKEYNLLDLKPEIERINLKKRPLIQVYIPGEEVISCFLSGMYWEQDCEAVDNINTLENTYHFYNCASKRQVLVESEDEDVPKVFFGNPPQLPSPGYEYMSGDYTFKYTAENFVITWEIIKNGVTMWRLSTTGDIPIPPYEQTLTPVSGTGAVGNVNIFINDIDVYARYLLDVDSVAGQNTFPIPSEDIAENSRNYHRVIGYNIANTIFFTDAKTTTPTKWGIYQPGIYYQEPYSVLANRFFPIGRSVWGALSVWFAFSLVDWFIEEGGRKEYTMQDANPISSVISVLLAKIAPNLRHEATTDYSEFLYSTYNPISGDSWKLMLTQKSNVLAGDYTQPAQKAPITLKTITDMLRDCFQAYWFVDGDKFRIEHIQYFLNGGTYNGTPQVGIDLTAMTDIRNGKPYAFSTSKYTFNKEEMSERYEFGWMDDVTDFFEGNPIEVISLYVDKGNIKKIGVDNFTSDVDYMLLNPNACSMDGFAVMAVVQSEGQNVLPFLPIVIEGDEYQLQNGYMSFYDLVRKYYRYNLPARNVIINGQQILASSTKRTKVQEVSFPSASDPLPNELVKTFLGNGEIRKMHVNLSSRNITTTLEYDTE